VITSATEERQLMLPAAGQASLPKSTINLPQSARETTLGLDEVRGASMNQSRALPANQPNTINASNTAQNVDIPRVIPRNEPIVEPYIPDDQLPVIQAGPTPRRQPINGPVVDYGTNPKVFGGDIESAIQRAIESGDMVRARALFEKLPADSPIKQDLAEFFDRIK
jgi:hypothetical protein